MKVFRNLVTNDSKDPIHLSTEMIRESTIRIENTEIRSTDITHSKFLMSRSSRRFRQVLKFPLLVLLFRLERFGIRELLH